MSSSSKQQTQTSHQQTTDPWSVQTPYLTQAFNGASTALGTAQNAVAPTNFTAQYTPDQLSAFQQMLGFGTGNQNIPGSSANAGTDLTGVGTNGVNSAIAKLTGYTPQGGIQSNIDAGNKFVAGMDIPSLVKAAMLPATQAASEQTLPSIGREAAATGNVNSSRRAIQEGIVQRGLGQQAEADAANLQGQGYQTGSALNEQNTEATNTNQLASILGLLTGGTSAATAGVGANTSSVGQAGGLFDIANGGIAGQQAGAQAPLTNQEQQFEAQTNDPFAALQNFYNIIGANNWGSSSTGSGTSTTTSTPSIFQTIGGLLTAAGSLTKSDERSKKDIHLIGELFDGQPVYRFRYKGDPTNAIYVGLMAQEVEEHYPEAVVEINGVKHVNYDIATQDAIVD